MYLIMTRKRIYLLIGAIVITCATACVTVYVQKDTTNSSINTSDTSENSADSASVDIDIPSEVFE